MTSKNYHWIIQAHDPALGHVVYWTAGRFWSSHKDEATRFSHAGHATEHIHFLEATMEAGRKLFDFKVEGVDSPEA